MTKLTHDDVRHIAKLARLNLSDEEVEKFANELGSILDFVEMLQEVDTESVETTSHVTGLKSNFRPDEIRPTDTTADALIETSPLPIIDRQIQTPSTHK